ncbi:hypothetical protein CA12_03280 [Alienimonas californiensis]|uniref:ImpA N-terminal domain-containing protein n=2 Tax=Alienimonas californiensis TaxID=2527989 RepID=A0A517P4E7_9PLAN|nr:hypothetical protein CA12_03280 [Alienimonas californiensis]
MSAGLPFRVDDLVAPCPGDDPCGEELGYGSEKFEIRDLAKELRSEEPGALGWKEVRDRATTALAETSKDLDLLTSFSEAALELHGVAGLGAALEVAGKLCEQYWDDLYPRVGEEDAADDLEARSTRLASLMDASGPDLPRRLRARELDTPPDTPNADLRKAFYQTAAAEIDACLAALNALEQAVDQGFEASFEKYDSVLPKSMRAEDFKPSGESLRDALRDRRDAVRDAFELAFPGADLDAAVASSDGEDAGADDAPAAAAAAPGGGPAGAPAGPPRTRAEAVNRLRQAVDYFRTAEPHSPVSLLVERAIRWAELPLTDVLAELVKDSDVLSKIRETLGVPEPKSEDDY